MKRTHTILSFNEYTKCKTIYKKRRSVLELSSCANIVIKSFDCQPVFDVKIQINTFGRLDMYKDNIPYSFDINCLTTVETMQRKFISSLPDTWRLDTDDFIYLKKQYVFDESLYTFKKILCVYRLNHDK